jgi:hypothetical protein
MLVEYSQERQCFPTISIPGEEGKAAQVGESA